MSYFDRLLAMSHGAVAGAQPRGELELERHEVIEVPQASAPASVARPSVERVVHEAAAARAPVIVERVAPATPFIERATDVKTVTRMIEAPAPRVTPTTTPSAPLAEPHVAQAPREDELPGVRALREVFHWVQAQPQQRLEVAESREPTARELQRRAAPVVPGPVREAPRTVTEAIEPVTVIAPEGVELTIGTIEVTIEEPPRAPVRASTPRSEPSRSNTRLERRLPRGS